jgi:hypothetical protein
MGKRNYTFSLEEKLITDFRVYIIRKKGDIKKNDLSEMLGIFIKNGIEQDRHHHQHTTYDQHAMSKEEEMIVTLTDLMKDISMYFWKLETPFPFRCGVDIHKKSLQKAIKVLRGSDYRTPKKWIDRFLEFGFIKKEPNNEYKILNDGHDSFDLKQEHEKQNKKEIEDIISQKGELMK